jgi:UDP-galactose transporter B1
MFLFCLANAVGQLFIFHIIRAFSPVVLVALTVTRKFVSVLVSVVRFGHAVYPWQWLGMAVLFAGLAMGDLLGTSKPAGGGGGKKKKAD